jgi:hypothetical protein
MTKRKRFAIPREEWPPGPWSDEPDDLEWSSRGFPCEIRRNYAGALCGYVAVPIGHPWHGRLYSELDVDVHGGLTHSGGANESDDWLVGFDCLHLGDIAPVWAAEYGRYDDRAAYREIHYVKWQVEYLVDQALVAGEQDG